MGPAAAAGSTISRFLKKKLNKWTEKVQTFKNSQEYKNCRLETKMYLLMDNNERLQAELRRLGQTMKALLQAAPTTSPCHGLGVAPKNNATLRKCLCKETAPAESVYTKPGGQRECRTLVHTNTVIQEPCDPQKEPSVAESEYLHAQDTIQPWGKKVKSGNHLKKSQPINLESDTISNPTNATQVGEQGMFEAEPSLLKGLEEDRENEEKAELELQILVEKLKDALSLEVKVGRTLYKNQEILSAAEHVSRSFCDLIKGSRSASLGIRPQ